MNHIIAELAWGHDGSVDQAINLTKAAKEAGADSISIHVTHLPSYIVPHYGSGKGRVSAGRESLDIYRYLDSINLSNEEWCHVADVAKTIGLQLCVMPNDIPSLEFSNSELDPAYYVVSPSCFLETEFLHQIAQKQRPTILRIGGAYLGEIESVINIFRTYHNNEIILLHGFQNYPTELVETDLAVLKTLKHIFGVEVGLADHIDGDSDLALVIPAVAVAFGTTYIEKHLTLDRSKKSEDFESALNPHEFSKMVDYIRAAEVATGNATFRELGAATISYRKIAQKCIVASKDILKDELFSKDNVAFKRSDEGLSVKYVDRVLGRRSRFDLSENDPINNDSIK